MATAKIHHVYNGTKLTRCVYKGDKLVATIEHTDRCAQHGSDCWHLLHLTGRCDHFETLSELRDEVKKL